MKLLIATLLIFSVNCSAYESIAYYVTNDQFSIDGYDFITNDRPFPIIQGKSYDVSEESQEDLPGGSFKKLVKISSLDANDSYIFTTRLINTTKKASIVDVKLLSKNIKWDVGDYGPAFGIRDASYEITLDDGEVFSVGYSKLMEGYISYGNTFVPGDQIEIRAEARDDSDFTRTRIYFYLIRDGIRIGNFSYSGVARQDNFHGVHPGIFTVNEIFESTVVNQTLKATVVSFFRVEGKWLIIQLHNGWQPPFTGLQYELTGKGVLRIVNRDEIVKLQRS
jgi:hypothetical protein